jgi:hypothetical protein
VIQSQWTIMRLHISSDILGRLLANGE